MREEFSGRINGLEDPLFFDAKTHHHLKKTENYVRVVLSRGIHRVCLVGGEYVNPIKPEDICVYDSLVRSSIDKLLGEQVLCFYSKEFLQKRKHLSFRIQKTQKQKRNLETLVIDETTLIPHFLNCIRSSKVRMLPHGTKKQHLLYTYPIH